MEGDESNMIMGLRVLGMLANLPALIAPDTSPLLVISVSLSELYVSRVALVGTGRTAEISLSHAADLVLVKIEVGGSIFFLTMGTLLEGYYSAPIPTFEKSARTRVGSNFSVCLRTRVGMAERVAGRCGMNRRFVAEKTWKQCFSPEISLLPSTLNAKSQ